MALQRDRVAVGGDTLVDAADVTLNNGAATLLLARDLDRREAILAAPLTNTVDVRVGSSTVTASRGVPLSPGQTLVLSTADAVYAFAGAAGQKVCVLVSKD